MKKKIFSTVFALILVLSFSLVAAVPAGAVTYDCELILQNKDHGGGGGSWDPIIDTPDDIHGVLQYNKAGAEFEYHLTATGLATTTNYSLIYYADQEERFHYWGGDNPGAVIGTFATDATGNIGPVAGSVDLGMNLPCPPDANMYDVDYCVRDGYDHCYGAKIWLIPTTQLDTGDVPVVGWPPDTGGVWLFETDLITYTDTSAPPAGSGTIIIQKVTEPVGAPDEFDFELLGEELLDGPIGDGEQIVVDNLAPGTYPVEEILPDGWALVDVAFDDTNSYWDDPDTELDTAFFVVDPCETVTGTFYNFGGEVTVDIIECPGCTDCEEDPYDVPVSTTFAIKAEITNVTGGVVGYCCGVKATLYWDSSDPVELVAGDKSENLGMMDPGETDTVAWTLHCTDPGDIDFYVDTTYGGYDECTVHQMYEPPGLGVSVDAPCEVCVECEPTDYVDALISNTGDCDITNITVTLTKTGPATISTPTRTIPLLTKGQSVWISDLAAGAWEFTCLGEGTVNWTVTANGTDVCTGEPLYLPGFEVSGTAITEQVETTVDVCVLGLSTEENDLWGEYGEQKYDPACGTSCGTDLDNMPSSATVSYDPAGEHSQRFQVSAYVYNCAETQVAKEMDVTLMGSKVKLLFNDDDTIDMNQIVDDPGDYWVGTSRLLWDNGTLDTDQKEDGGGESWEETNGFLFNSDGSLDDDQVWDASDYWIFRGKLLFNDDGTVDVNQKVEPTTGDYWEYGGVCDNGTPKDVTDDWLSWRIDKGEPVYCYAMDPPGPQRHAVHEPVFTDPEPGTIRVDQVCPCCTAIVTWICECMGPGCGDCCPVDGDQIAVSVQEVMPDPSNDPWSNEPCNPAYIYQEPKAHLTTEMQAYVTGCDGCPVLVDTVAESQDSDVLLTIANIGTATAKDVIISGNVWGPTTCEGSFSDFDIGDIDGGESVSFWFSEMLNRSIPCHCTGEGTVTFQLYGLEGYDENTCELIPGDNIELDCPLYVEQCDIQVEIINPVECTDICTGDEFAVKAKLTNCGNCNFEDVKFYLSWTGPGMVEVEDGLTRMLPDLVEIDSGCPSPPPPECGVDAWDVVAPCLDCFECTSYEMTWQVECTKPGDVTFDVCVTTDDDRTPEGSIFECEEPDDSCVATETPDDLDPVPHLVIQSLNNPTIHQQPKPEITIEIISPENLDTFVGTGQEFAVTVAIANKTDWSYSEVYPVTVTDIGLLLHPDMDVTILDGPVTPIELAGGEVRNVTFTLECNKSGLMTIDAWAVAETGFVTAPCCPPFEAFSFPLLLWQYPAAHLDIVIDRVEPGTTISVCENFDVYYTVTNTGEADATEVDAMLSVTPEGSARPVEGIGSGYTTYIGTIPGHGQGEPYEGVWNLHCKEACESTININADGYDENGWHKKQVCQSTGNFIIEAGGSIMAQTGGGVYANLDGDPASGVMATILIGEASGLIGPFNLTVPVSFNGEDMGTLTAMGAVIPDMDYTSFASHVSLIESALDAGCFDLLDLLEWFNLQGVDKDVMIFVGQLNMDSMMDEFPGGGCGCWCASAGLLQIINGGLNGAGVSLTCWEGLDVMTFLDGTYCSTMAQEALRPIEAKFIEDANVTVKQLPGEGLDLGIIKTVDEPNPETGATIDYTIMVTNYGPGEATGVEVTDDLWDTVVTYVADDPTQGSYDDATGVWTVGNLTVGASASLTLTASVTAETEFINTATVSCNQADGNPRNDTDSAIINRSLATQLESGWNFVSWPLIPFDPTTEVVLADLDPLTTNLESVWGNYDPLALLPEDQWDSYDPDSITNTLLEMNDGVGFWIEMITAGNTILIDGQVQPDPPATPAVYDVVGGSGGYWNAIGFKSTIPQSPDTYLAGIAGKYTIIYGYDEGEYFVVGTPGNMMLEPGLAYYIAVLESGKIFP